MKRSKIGRELLLVANLFGDTHATTMIFSYGTGMFNYSLATIRPSFAPLNPVSYSSSSASTSVAAFGAPAAVPPQETVAGVTTPNTPGHISSTTDNMQTRPTAAIPGWPLYWPQILPSATSEPDTVSRGSLPPTSEPGTVLGGSMPQTTQLNGLLKAKSGHANGPPTQTSSTYSHEYPTTGPAHTIDAIAGSSSRVLIDVQTTFSADNPDPMSASSNDVASESSVFVTTSSDHSMVHTSATPTTSASTVSASTAAAAASPDLRPDRKQLLFWLVLAVLCDACSI